MSEEINQVEIDSIDVILIYFVMCVIVFFLVDLSLFWESYGHVDVWLRRIHSRILFELQFAVELRVVQHLYCIGLPALAHARYGYYY